jgi:fluoroacetyl-CoA thioesterase
MDNIEIGSKSVRTLLVTSDVAIDFLGSENARVLSTPSLIGYTERTCRDLVLPQLEGGYDTVGTHVDIHHFAAAPIGSVVTFTSEIAAVRDRRIEYRISARTDEELIGEGKHERAIIDVAKFVSRLAEKRKAKD